MTDDILEICAKYINVEFLNKHIEIVERDIKEEIQYLKNIKDELDDYHEYVIKAEKNIIKNHMLINYMKNIRAFLWADMEK